MPLTKLSILQIGDVHFPEWKAGISEIDLKVNRFSERIVSDLQTDTLVSVLEGLRNVCRCEAIHAAILMGDLTSQGRTQYLDNAATVISGLINDSDTATQIPVFGVPGNHDVAKADAVDLGDYGKFRPLERAFAKVRWGQLPIQTYVQQLLDNAAGMEVPLYLLNSSIGSWSKALYPDGLRELIFSDDESPIRLCDPAPFGDSATSASGAGTLTAQVYEQLDTPYFRAVDIQAIAEKIERRKGAAIVVAHHNLLPQYLPRISSFGEVLNAGHARQLLLASGAGILYLHGHIHTDPVEIVRAPGEDGMIVSIAAPVFWKGFNVVSLFQEVGGSPFVAKIVRHRVGPAGFGTSTEVIPLTVDPAELLKKDTARFWSRVKSELASAQQRVFNWNELAAIASRSGLPRDQLEPTLLALYCSSLIEIRNFDASTSAWRINLKD